MFTIIEPELDYQEDINKDTPDKISYHLMEDDSGHWYVIPSHLDNEFYEWMDAEINGDETELDFNSCRINGHPNRIHFKEYYEE